MLVAFGTAEYVPKLGIPIDDAADQLGQSRRSTRFIGDFSKEKISDLMAVMTVIPAPPSSAVGIIPNYAFLLKELLSLAEGET